MCGIVGILGRGPVAEQLVDSLKRLEYRGYDSAGVATLEGDHLDRRRAEGKLKNLEARLQGRAARRAIPASATPAGPPTASRPKTTRIRMPTDNVAVVHNGIIENFRELRQMLEKQGAIFTSETDTEIVAHLVNSYIAQGRFAAGGGEGVAAAVARRVRAGVHVQGPRRSDDRRPQGLAAGDRPWRRRDVSRLGRDRAGAVHRHHQLSRGRRLGGADPRSRRDLRRAGRGREPRGAEIRRVVVPGRQGELSPLHGQGNPRAARSGRPHAGALCRHGDRAGGAAGQAAVRFQGYPAHFDRGLRHRELCRLRRQILVRAARPRAGRTRCRLRIPLPRSAAAQGRSRDLHFAIRRDRRYAGGAALRQVAGRAHALGGQRADLDHRARKRDRAADAGRAGNRRRLDQGVHLPADGAGRDRGRRRQGARRIVRCRRSQAGAWPGRNSAADGGGARHRAADRKARARHRQIQATCSISAAAPAIRWRWKAR